MAIAISSGRKPFARLRKFVRKPGEEQAEICELCAASLPAEHQHLLELEKHQIACACDACAILFVDDARQSYRRIPRDVFQLHNFNMDDQQWESLLIPINLAFFVRSSRAGRVLAQYPSPAGAMESSLHLDDWSAIVAHNPGLDEFSADVEALLVNRISHPAQYFRAPIDHCYRLVGLIRRHWRGLSGGPEVWREIDRFFERLRAISRGHRA